MRRQPSKNRATARALSEPDARAAVMAIALQTSIGLLGLILILLLTGP